MKKIFLKSLLFVAFQLSFAQTNFDVSKLNRYFDELEKNDKFMGSVAVSENGKVIYSRAIGYADVENKQRANETSKYRIGSISKTFTAVLILKAVEERKVKLNQTISKWFPALKNSDRITIEYLLNHRSGIYNFTDDKDYLTWNTESKNENEMLEIIAKGGSDFEPNTKSKYSNSNYVILTYILEKIYKKPYADILQEHIVKPIGLANTKVFGKINPSNNECKSYTFEKGWKLEKETDFTVPLGAGAIVSTPNDLTKFADALFGGKLLNSKSLKKMKTINEKYGLGVFQLPFYEHRGYGHTGGIDGFSSIFAYFPENKISYAQVSNGTNYNSNDVSIAMLSAIYNKPYEISVFTNYATSEEELEKYVGVYSSADIPLKITISKEGTVLKGQATGQQSFILEASEKDTFRFDKVGLKMEFNPLEKTMILTQGGQKIKFVKD
ncbi:serine hydrolase [Riemerella anatipestifer]|nr:serine hydrolase [Riemerella anatipestifer]